MPLGRYSVGFWDMGVMCFLEHDGAGQTHEIRLDIRRCAPELQSCARLHGHVLLPDGRQSLGCVIVVLGADIGEQPVFHRFVDAAGGGFFDISNVQPGTYRLWVPFSSYARIRTRAYTSEVFALHGGEEVESDVRLVLDLPEGSSPR